MVDLTVVLIGKNQEWNIARLIESVLKQTSSVASREIIYVDSASTDKTTEIASRYPIGVLQLPAEQQLTAAAGRFTGYKFSSGAYLLFLDGDMEMWDGWLSKALTIMKERPEAAGITGKLIDMPVDAQAADYTGPGPESFGDGVEEITQTGGAALFRRTVLEEVGTYNPFIYSDEEPELCLRIRYKGGYKLLRTDQPISFHYSTPLYKISTLFARRKRNLYLGFGQVMRYHLGDDLFRPYMKERGFVVIPGVALLLGLISLAASLVTRNAVWFLAWVMLLVAVILLDALRKRSLYMAVYSFVQRFVIFEGTLKGIFSDTRAPEEYPETVKIIKPVTPITTVEEEAKTVD